MPPAAESLPPPNEVARAHGMRVAAALAHTIERAGGWIPFERWMRDALYAPGLGYYVAGARKFGAEGDFVTAPELTPLFGAALATPIGQVLAAGGGDIVELGAGSGRLAVDVMAALDADQRLPGRYRIVEVSPDLRERQRSTVAQALPHLVDRFEWLGDLPERIEGVVLMNEVLDAVPVHLIARVNGEWLERGVIAEGERFAFAARPLADARLRSLAQERFPRDMDYSSELNPAAEALVETLATRLDAGAMLIIDYGFPRREYYHPQRSTGTLMVHYRHRAHTEPLLWPGLADITAHVDFTAMAEAGVRAGADVAGFASQAAFLVGSGILDRLAGVGPVDSIGYMREAAAVQTLLSPAEMGELFKVLALAKGEDLAWRGFSIGDMRHRL